MADESGQSLSHGDDNTNAALIRPAGSQLDHRQLLYTPVEAVRYRDDHGAVDDNGGALNGGDDVITRTFVVNVATVNDAPSFTPAPTRP